MGSPPGLCFSIHLLSIIAMTILSVFIAATRIGQIAAPIVAAQFTAISDEYAIALSLLWLPFLFTGYGGDIFTQEFGFEASMYFLLLVIVKSVPWVVISYTSIYWWAPVVFVYLVYFVAVHTPLRIYYDDTGFTREEQLEVYGQKALSGASDSTRKELEESEFQHISFRNLALLVGFVTLINAGRTILMWYHSEATLDASYYDEDTILLYSMAAETVLAAWIMVRLRSLYSRFNRDFWQGAGGVLAFYVYFQLVDIWITPTWAEVGITAGLVLGIIVLAIVIERQVTDTHIDKEQFVGLVLLQWAAEIVHVLLSDRAGQLIYIVLCGFIAFNSQEIWYSTRTDFPMVVRKYVCPIQDFINGPVQVFYNVTTGEYKKLFALVNIPMARVRSKVTQAIFSSYPAIQSGCEGVYTEFEPIQTYWVVPFLILPWLFGLFLTLQPFIEARRVINTTSFWAVTFVTCVLSFIVMQFMGDIQASVWYLVLNDTNINRTYSWEGILGTVAQILQMALCVSMYRNKATESDTRKRLRREGYVGGGGPAQTQSEKGVAEGVVSTVQGLADSAADPQYLLMGASIVLLLYSLYNQGTPVDNISITYQTTPGNPPWLRAIVPDGFGSEDANLFLMMSRSIIKVAALINLLEFVADRANLCFDVGLETICPLKSILSFAGNLTRDLEEAIAPIADGFVDNIAALIGNGTFQDVLTTLRAVPTTLIKLPSFSLFSVPQIDLLSLRIPVWLPYLSGAVVIGFFLTSLFVLVFSGRLKQELEVAKTFFMGFVVAGAVTVVSYAATMIYYLDTQGFAVTISWNNNIWQYVASLLLFLVSFFFSIGKKLEPDLERKELAEAAKQMHNAKVGAGETTRLMEEEEPDEEEEGGTEGGADDEGEPVRRVHLPVRPRSQRLRANPLSRLSSSTHRR